MKSPVDWSRLKDKNMQKYLAVLLAAGVLVMLLGKWFPAAPKQTGPTTPVNVSQPSPLPPAQTGFHAERELEKRLEEAFSAIENVGRVRVLLSFTRDRETVYASDGNTSDSHSREVDGQGGSRETRSTQRQDKTIIITDKAGVDRPLVLREIEPKIAGVVIIAEGGDSVFVKDALTKAACTVLGIEANKVQVMKMKEIEGR
jgi:stage III sporulation protein AG